MAVAVQNPAWTEITKGGEESGEEAVESSLYE
jgi:hypothetical protein